MRKVYQDPNGNKHYSKPSKLCVNGKTYSPVTDKRLKEAGWKIEEIIDQIPEQYIPTYAELVETYIREHGYPTYGAELAVLNNYTTDPATYINAFAAYQHTRNEAKAWAESQPHRAEEGE